MNASVPGLAAVDGARAALLRTLGAPGRALLRDPSLRVVLYGLVGLAVALALTCAAPMHTFALAPLVLGVPHLLVDVRYLVARPGLHRRRWLSLAAGTPLVLSAFVGSPAVGLASAVAVAVLARGSVARRTVVGAVAATLVALAAAEPEKAVLVFVHGHNLVGAVFVLAVFSRRRWLEAIPIAAFAGIAVAVVLGAFDGALLRPFALTAPDSADSLYLTALRLAPDTDVVLAVRLVALFVFAQGVHYVAWLRLVPELARERRGVRSFSSSARHLAKDLGAPCLLLAAGAFVVLLVVAWGRSLSDARNLYLSLAAFHGPLEIAALALVAVEGRSTLAVRPAPTC